MQSVHFNYTQLHLFCCSLQALIDIRPSSEEIDKIADIIKDHPKGVLDKPEQLILLLAMIPNLEERLKVKVLCIMF